MDKELELKYKNVAVRLPCTDKQFKQVLDVLLIDVQPPTQDTTKVNYVKGRRGKYAQNRRNPETCKAWIMECVANKYLGAGRNKNKYRNALHLADKFGLKFNTVAAVKAAYYKHR